MVDQNIIGFYNVTTMVLEYSYTIARFYGRYKAIRKTFGSVLVIESVIINQKFNKHHGSELLVA